MLLGRWEGDGASLATIGGKLLGGVRAGSGCDNTSGLGALVAGGDRGEIQHSLSNGFQMRFGDESSLGRGGGPHVVFSVI